MVKTCFRCGEAKPIDAFYRHPAMADGRLGKCAECTRNDVRLNRERNIDKVRAYDRARGYRSDPVKAKAREAARSIPAQPCSMCGSEPAERHHEDYRRPFDVTWLCKQHHGAAHRVYV